MILYLLYMDGSFEKVYVTRFSNLSEDKSQFYYYETLSDSCGHGTCVRRDHVRCFELCLGPNALIDEHFFKE